MSSRLEIMPKALNRIILPNLSYLLIYGTIQEGTYTTGHIGHASSACAAWHYRLHSALECTLLRSAFFFNTGLKHSEGKNLFTLYL